MEDKPNNKVEKPKEDKNMVELTIDLIRKTFTEKPQLFIIEMSALVTEEEYKTILSKRKGNQITVKLID